MPFSSKQQVKWMFANHPEMAKRWAAHTPDMKKLPATAAAGKKDDDKDAEKKAFASAFVLGCRRAGVTDPAAIAAVAEKFAAAVLEAAARTKAALDPVATAADAAGRGAGWLTNAALLGSVGLPLTLGFAGGYTGGKVQNQMDVDDHEALRMMAEANAYRRRAAQAKTDLQVRKLMAKDPKKYVQLA